jgi:hypothetical protein
VVKDFKPFENFKSETDTLKMEMDLSEAITKGITIPSEKLNKSNYFKFSFSVRNNSKVPKIFYYKIYYQNDSYKYQEFIERGGHEQYNWLSANNFYGSWVSCSEEFHKTAIIPNDRDYYEIKDSFQIVGNPREEEKYFSAEVKNTKPTKSDIDAVIMEIKLTPKWIAQVKKNAKENNISTDEQLYQDAFWSLDQRRSFQAGSSKKKTPAEINKMVTKIKADKYWMEQIEKKAKTNNIPLNDQIQLDALWALDNETKVVKVNNRWQRNPRTGNYSFMLIVADENGIKRIPVSVKNISKLDDSLKTFYNPFYFFLHSKAADFPNEIVSVVSEKVLKTKASLSLSKGIYIDLFKNKESGIDTSGFNESIGNSDKIFYEAHFEQFFHNINKNFKLKNIPVAADVVADNYSPQLYNANKEKYKNTVIGETYVEVARKLGKTVGFDKTTNAIFMKNPGNTDTSKLVKENVGVNTRVGFTYGKFRAKIKFPVMLNAGNVWNGVTCAFWLLYQDNAEWNNRSVCKGSGYIPKNEVGETNNRVQNTNYSEIDIEIVKTSRYWPKSSYTNNMNEYKSEDPAANSNLIVACTNWDLACREPKNFNIGIRNIKYEDNEFALHRWSDWYKALTSKYTDVQSNIVGDFIYYEIDWQPERIIWRIGKSKDNMKVIGYMDDRSTKIPDNQMIAVITQEFHDASWWPLTPWDQNFIPYPKNDIVGYIYEIEIE